MSFSLYKSLLRPLLFAADPESVHHLAMRCLSTAAPLLRHLAPRMDRRLERTVFGIHFPNPVGLAAGFDKNAVALCAWEALGFGFAEMGTITSRAQDGNPRPRIFRVPEQQAIINRLGFNNDGADLIASRLRRLTERRRWARIPIGINIGKSKVTPLDEATNDYVLTFERLHQFGDYFVLNISSPNTPGLRMLQDRRSLDGLLDAIQRRNNGRKPMLIKIAPDLDWEQIEEIVGLAEEHGLSGIIATNTTTDQSSLPIHRRQQGGLSGGPLRQRSTEIIRFITKRTQLPVIAVGGINSVDAALEKADAGAALLQVYTGLIYEGPALVRDICAALLAWS